MQPPAFSGKRVLVMGLGLFGGGVGVTRFLCRHQARVTVTDLRPPAELAESLAALDDLDVTFHLGQHHQHDFSPAATDLVVVNPAVKPNSKFLALAQSQHLTLTTETNIFFQHCLAPIIAITGSNGKSTTTAMTTAVLRAADNHRGARPYRRVFMGGNIGQQNLLEHLDEITHHDLVVLELSSFQLHHLATIKRSPHVAVVTNISPNHLDWHTTMDAYIQAKQNILIHQTPADWTLLYAHDNQLRSWPPLTPAQTRFYDPADNHQLTLQVPGQHNRANAAAALAVGRIFGVPDHDAHQALAQFAGLEHRLEFVAEINHVRYYNDSIATTPESTAAAIDALDLPKTLIMGGYDKNISFAPLAQTIVENPSVHTVILIGAVSDTLLAEINHAKTQANRPSPTCLQAHSLQHAVQLANQHAQPQTAVALSPACASYDMFKNFQDRGNQFKTLVKALQSQNG